MPHTPPPPSHQSHSRGYDFHCTSWFLLINSTIASYSETSASHGSIVAPCTTSIVTHIRKRLSVLFRGILASPSFVPYSPPSNKYHGHKVSLQWFLVFSLQYSISSKPNRCQPLIFLINTHLHQPLPNPSSKKMNVCSG